jgi:hypothetical protein
MENLTHVPSSVSTADQSLATWVVTVYGVT